MKKYNGPIVSFLSSYWKMFRLFFVIFSLYLMGIAFYSWDGYKYYGSLYDFMSGIALVLQLWSILALILAIFVSLFFKVVEWGFLGMGQKIRIEHILMFLTIFISLAVLAWKGNTAIRNDFMVTQQIKLIMLAAVAIISIVLTTLFRNKGLSWINLIQERITPLVWLFGILALLSIPLIAYQIAVNNLWGEKDKAASLDISRTSMPNKKQPNIILVTFDALTARDMSVYGYDRETTPFITEWAKEASVFTMAEAESNYTSPTSASIMTGKRVWSHQLYAPHGYNVINADTENLALYLKNNGYYNIALVQNSFASPRTLGISDSFDIEPIVAEFMEPISIVSVTTKALFRLFGDKYHRYNWLLQTAFLGPVYYHKIPVNVMVTEYPPEMVFDNFLGIMGNNPPEPFFAWLHVFPPHDPYLPPEPYMGMFDPSQKLRTEKSQWLTADFKTARARYDEFIRYCDKEFEVFIKELARYNKNIVIALSADHGHSFEHGKRGHGGPYLYEQLTNIPLIIKEPYQTEGKIINDVVEQIDIAPTLLELAKVNVPSWIEGQSLVPLMQGKEFPLKPAFSMELESTPSGHEIREGTFAVWYGDYKLIHYLKNNKSLLFNLKEDPGELNNLFDEEPEIGSHLLALIQDNLSRANKRIEMESTREER